MARRAAGLVRGARKAEDTESGGSSNSFLGIVRPEARLQPAREGLQPGVGPTEAAARPGGPAGEGAESPAPERRGPGPSPSSYQEPQPALEEAGSLRPTRSLGRPGGEATAHSGHPRYPGGASQSARGATISDEGEAVDSSKSLFSLGKHHEFVAPLDFVVPRELFFCGILARCSRTWQWFQLFPTFLPGPKMAASEEADDLALHLYGNTAPARRRACVGGGL